MRDLVTSAVDGFLGSFLLAGAIVAAVATGIWRGTAHAYSTFVQHRPLATPGIE